MYNPWLFSFDHLLLGAADARCLEVVFFTCSWCVQVLPKERNRHCRCVTPVYLHQFTCSVFGTADVVFSCNTNVLFLPCSPRRSCHVPATAVCGSRVWQCVVEFTARPMTLASLSMLTVGHFWLVVFNWSPFADCTARVFAFLCILHCAGKTNKKGARKGNKKKT